ncbi:hypothetical protein [Bifidobacterium sp. ESL0790]|uniref:hypothetical protein n=1 Tax=Bifidobacterium sp. ESL0790 TaxID=2983233 RepID=UPI0023F672E2|nr:hypothetical protein [Bifidobacterium sp. ESL0790]WEV72128.1 hypothetical protein OZY47_06725 [Bifidobacterium sp. ESL0790]
MSTRPSEEVCGIVDQRDGYECLVCGGMRADGWSGESRHHRLMRSHSFPRLHSPENMMRVCGSGTTGCHGRIHAHPGMAYRLGWLVHEWVEDPSEVPCKTCRHGWVFLEKDGTMRPLTKPELDEWLLATGLKWRREDIGPHVGDMCSVTLGTGFRDFGKLTGVKEDSSGVVVVTLDHTQPWRLEDNATINFNNLQGEHHER